MPATPNGPITEPALEVAADPPHPSLPVPPLAVQLVAFDVDQVNVVEPPTVIELGVALKAVTVAGGVGAVTVIESDCTELDPPGPVHDNE